MQALREVDEKRNGEHPERIAFLSIGFLRGFWSSTGPSTAP